MIRLAAALIAVATTASLPGQKPTFSARVEAVRVDVLVTDNGRPVRGLRAGDFELFDNGVRQRVDLASVDTTPINVVLALDTSGSLEGDRLPQLQRAGLGVLQALKPEDRAALVTFSHTIGLPADLTRDHVRVRDALEAVTAEGYTALVDGTYAAMLVAEADEGRSLLIVFSDGLDTASWLPEGGVLNAARAIDVVVYGVSAGRSEARFVRDLCRLTGGTLFEVAAFSGLRATFLKVLEEFRQRYLLSYTPTGVPPDGWHKLEVRTRGRRTTVKARPGYLGAR